MMHHIVWTYVAVLNARGAPSLRPVHYSQLLRSSDRTQISKTSGFASTVRAAYASKHNALENTSPLRSKSLVSDISLRKLSQG